MTDQQTAIAPPPSLADILARQEQERIGRVDFTHRLAPEPPATTGTEQHPTESTPGTAAGVAASPAAQAPRVEPAPTPDQLVATVGEAPAAATGTAPSGPAVAAATDVEDGQDATSAPQPEPRSKRRRTRGAAASAAAPSAAPSTAASPEPSPDPSAQPTPGTSAAAAETQPETRPETGPEARPEAQVAALLSLVPAEDLATVGESFEDVVDTVLARIRAAEIATVRHLAAVEEEAARRCEMVTAQAELDAELIRLHARREAHAIIAASRLRAGHDIAPTPHESRLHQLGDATERLAEALESWGEGPASPDHPFLR